MTAPKPTERPAGPMPPSPSHRGSPRLRPPRGGWRLFGWRRLDLFHNGTTFLRRRGLDNWQRFGILVHRIDAPDPGLDLHDHPWPFATLILRGGYTEQWSDCADLGYGRQLVNDGQPALPWGNPPRTWRAGSVHRMPLTVAHRITAAEPGTVTLVLRGRKQRRWGFYQQSRWIDWEAYDYDARRPCTVESDRPREERDELEGDG